jgi:hypothetical protein
MRRQNGHTSVTPHIWTGGFGTGGVPVEEFADNILSFASRNDLTVVVSQWTTSKADAESLQRHLELADAWDVEVWLGTYDLREYSDAELVADEEKMEADLNRLHRMVDTYAEYFPDGNVFLWHEAPLSGKWTGDTRAEQADNIVRNGPEIFAAQYESLKSAHPELSVGLFVHQPFLAPPSHTDKPIYGPLMDRLSDRAAVPDFTYFDMYRFHFDWDVGYEAVSDYLDAIVRNVRDQTDDRPVHFLADNLSRPMPTDAYETDSTEPKPAYTPSKQAMLGHLRTALEAGVESAGWYLGKNWYPRTRTRNYEPFVPNTGTTEQSHYNSMVLSRDRFVWATLALREATRGVDPDDHFDLWLYGHDFGFYQHAVELRTVDGEWEFVGDISGYLDGDNPYSSDGRDRVVAFHGLDRDRYLGDELTVRLSSYEDGDGATLHSAYAVPYLDAAHYRTEPELTTLAAERSDLEALSVAATETDAELSPGTKTRVALETNPPTADFRRILRPAQRDAFARLERRERDNVTTRDAFDLWLYGDGLTGIDVSIDDESAAEYAAEERVNDAAVAYRGLRRSRFFDGVDGRLLPLEVKAVEPARVAAAYVMPYHGTTNFKTDAEVAATIERDYMPGKGEGQLSTFALGYQGWPGGIELAAGDRIETRVSMNSRRINGFAEFES